MKLIITSINLYAMLCSVKITLPYLDNCSKSVHSWSVPLSRLEQTLHIVKSYTLLLILYRKYVYHILKDFLIKNIVSDAIISNNFVVSAEWTAKVDPKKSCTHKEFNCNKLRQAALFCLSQCGEVVKIEMTGLP